MAEITIYRKIMCPECLGEGLVRPSDTVPCPECKGTGLIEVEKRVSVEELWRMMSEGEE